MSISSYWMSSGVIHREFFRRQSRQASLFAIVTASTFGLCGTSIAHTSTLHVGDRGERFGIVEEAFASPPEYRSKDGQLSVTMEARPTRVIIGGREVDGATYNGVYAGPVLRLKPGDTLHFHLINHLPQATNVHFHGLGVSPQGPWRQLDAHGEAGGELGL